MKHRVVLGCQDAHRTTGGRQGERLDGVIAGVVNAFLRIYISAAGEETLGGFSFHVAVSGFQLGAMELGAGLWVVVEYPANRDGLAVSPWSNNARVTHREAL